VCDLTAHNVRAAVCTTRKLHVSLERQITCIKTIEIEYPYSINCARDLGQRIAVKIPQDERLFIGWQELNFGHVGNVGWGLMLISDSGREF